MAFVSSGEFVSKELLAMIEIHKYRAMKSRYEKGP
jgi:hypothetical protein